LQVLNDSIWRGKRSIQRELRPSKTIRLEQAIDGKRSDGMNPVATKDGWTENAGLEKD